MSTYPTLVAILDTHQRGRGGTQASTLQRALREVPLIAMLYLVYAGGRLLASHHAGEAFHHAEQVWSFERAIGLPSEHSLQQLALNWTWLIKAMGVYYARVHFPATIGVLVWLFIRRPEAYPWFRWTLVLLTGFGLVGHVLYPLAPPRMLPDHGMVDTAKVFGESVYGQVGTGLANQFAAMPSLHVGWAVLIAIALITTLRSKWRWLIVLHPVITLAVVVITGNHYWLDGIVAGLLLVLALAITRPLHPAAAQSAEVERPASLLGTALARLSASSGVTRLTARARRGTESVRTHAWPLIVMLATSAAAGLGRYALLGIWVFPSATAAAILRQRSAPREVYDDADGLTVADTVPAEWSHGTGSPARTESSALSMASASVAGSQSSGATVDIAAEPRAETATAATSRG